MKNGVPTFFSEDGNIFENLKSLANESSFLLGHLTKIPEYAAVCRKIDRKEQPNLYSFMVNFYLDILKYRITNAHKKCGIRRRIERLFKRKYINEIPNLVTLLRSVGETQTSDDL